ncbi:MAG: sn-glycerol-3-phosphate ABC transporter ATP-binding protein UgpC [Acidimicrobiales bacterium]
MARVAFESVTKRFGSTLAVSELTLAVDDGEFMVLLGPSGCGKSTALRMVAGLDEPTAGSIRIGERVVDDIEAKDRDVAMVFQSYALYPHLSARKNIEFPLRTRKVDRSDRARLVADAAEALGLTDLLDRRPGQMSGGQRQRVALARAIVRRPQVFLMDEPLSNLDAKLRVQTRAELVELQQRLATTAVYVTHDQVEAMTMGHRIAVMDSGVLQQLGPPQDVYERPANLFVARFIGSPPMNTIAGTATTADGQPAVAVPGAAVAVGDVRPSGADVVVGVRPEHVRISGDGLLPATVTLVESLGHERHVVCRLADGQTVIARQAAALAVPAPGAAVRLQVDPTDLHFFDGTTGLRMEPA